MPRTTEENQRIRAARRARILERARSVFARCGRQARGRSDREASRPAIFCREVCLALRPGAVWQLSVSRFIAAYSPGGRCG
jgi:hypothetical protein